jgi:hypothetical protein
VPEKAEAEKKEKEDKERLKKEKEYLDWKLNAEKEDAERLSKKAERLRKEKTEAEKKEKEDNLLLFLLLLPLSCLCVLSLLLNGRLGIVQNFVSGSGQGGEGRKETKVHPSWQNTEMTTKLWLVITSNNNTELQTILKEDPSRAKLRDADGRGPLFWAHEANNAQAIVLLKKLGAEEDAAYADSEEEDEDEAEEEDSDVDSEEEDEDEEEEEDTSDVDGKTCTNFEHKKMTEYMHRKGGGSRSKPEHQAGGVSRPREPIPKKQTDDLSVTNASHVYDCDLANKLLPPGTLAKDQQKSLDRFLTSVVNLPIKTRSGPGGNIGPHPDSDIVLDKEIMKAIETGQPLSDDAFARVCAKVALGKGKALDSGFNDDSIKALINPLVGLRDGNGTTVDEEYFVPYKNGKPVNIWKDYPRKVTGLKDNGEPDERTTKGKERAANAKTFEQDTGLTKDGQASQRTTLMPYFGSAVLLLARECDARQGDRRSDYAQAGQRALGTVDAPKETARAHATVTGTGGCSKACGESIRSSLSQPMEHLHALTRRHGLLDAAVV